MSLTLTSVASFAESKHLARVIYWGGYYWVTGGWSGWNGVNQCRATVLRSPDLLNWTMIRDNNGNYLNIGSYAMRQQVSENGDTLH